MDSFFSSYNQLSSCLGPLGSPAERRLTGFEMITRPPCVLPSVEPSPFSKPLGRAAERRPTGIEMVIPPPGCRQTSNCRNVCSLGGSSGTAPCGHWNDYSPPWVLPNAELAPSFWTLGSAAERLPTGIEMVIAPFRVLPQINLSQFVEPLGGSSGAASYTRESKLAPLDAARRRTTVTF